MSTTHTDLIAVVWEDDVGLVSLARKQLLFHAWDVRGNWSAPPGTPRVEITDEDFKLLCPDAQGDDWLDEANWGRIMDLFAHKGFPLAQRLVPDALTPEPSPSQPAGEPTKHVRTITVRDPDSGGMVEVEIRKCMESGTLVGIDGSFLEDDFAEVNNPYNPGILLIPDDEVKQHAENDDAHINVLPDVCDECGAEYPADADSLFGEFHDVACSLHTCFRCRICGASVKAADRRQHLIDHAPAYGAADDPAVTAAQFETLH
jgi:hypothetical protein